MQVGWLTMIPYICGAISMVFCGWLSDRIGDRRWSLFTTCVISTIGLVMAGLTIGTWWALVGITIAAIGDRVLRHQGTVLVDADDVPDGRRRRCRHSVDQFARQSGRVLRPDIGRLGKGSDRQLRRRPLRPRTVCLGVGRDLAVLAPHPAPHRRTRRSGRPGGVAVFEPGSSAQLLGK